MNRDYFHLRRKKREKLKRDQRLRRFGACLLVLAVLAALTMALPALGRILPGVSYEGIGLGGLTREGAEEKLNKHQVAFQDRDIRLTHGGRETEVKRGDLGLALPAEAVAVKALVLSEKTPLTERLLTFFVRPEVDVPLEVQEAELIGQLEKLDGRLYEGAKPVRLKTTGKRVEVMEAKAGEAVDIKALAAQLKKGKETVEVPTYSVEAPESDAGIEAIDTLLASWTTTYDRADKSRAVNVRRGASFFRRRLLAPGERLSFLETIGGITEANGFAEGETLSAGVETTGVGGGVCQVSTTMYNAAVRADLHVLSRHNHSKPVEYAEEGTDCAVTDGYKDFIFTNPYPHPVYLETICKGGKLTCRIYGHGADKPDVIDLVAERVATLPAGEETVLTASLRPGERRVAQPKRDGAIYRSYKVHSRDGRELRRDYYDTSRYVPVDGKILVGN